MQWPTPLNSALRELDQFAGDRRQSATPVESKLNRLVIFRPGSLGDVAQPSTVGYSDTVPRSMKLHHPRILVVPPIQFQVDTGPVMHTPPLRTLELSLSAGTT
jgi:hypothetical protein